MVSTAIEKHMSPFDGLRRGGALEERQYGPRPDAYARRHSKK